MKKRIITIFILISLYLAGSINCFAWKTMGDSKKLEKIYQLTESGDFEKAIEEINSLIPNYLDSPDDLRFLVLQKVDLLLKSKRFDEATATCNLETQAFGRDITTAKGFDQEARKLSLLVNVYMAFEKWDKALECQLELIDFLNKTPKPNDMSDQTIEGIRKISVNQFHTERLGDIYAKLARHKQALECYQRALNTYTQYSLAESKESPPAEVNIKYKVNMELPLKIAELLEKIGNKEETLKHLTKIKNYLTDSTVRAEFKQKDPNYLPVLDESEMKIDKKLKELEKNMKQ